MYEDGFDSDGELGPFFDAVVGKRLYTYQEPELLEAPSLLESENSNFSKFSNVSNVSNSNAGPRTFRLGAADPGRLDKIDLQCQLELLGLSKEWNREELLQRLKSARESRLQYRVMRLLDGTSGQGDPGNEAPVNDEPDQGNKENATGVNVGESFCLFIVSNNSALNFLTIYLSRP